MQIRWVNGYLAGVVDTSDRAGDTPAGGSPPLTLLFGTETGNGRRAAELAAEEARNRGFSVHTADMREFRKAQWQGVQTLLVIVSTHGEGEPPDGAREVYDLLHSKRAPRLTGTPFAVLALGDSSYDNYCQTGRDLDRRLEELGATRLQPRRECDLEFEQPAREWIAAVLDGLQRDRPAQPLGVTPAARLPDVPARQRYDRTRPFQAEVLENVQLSGRGSHKRVHHLELAIDASGLDYQPGDALWVLPQNAPEHVAELLAALGCTGEESVSTAAGDMPLAQALSAQYEITRVARGFLARYAELARCDSLTALLAEDAKKRLRGYASGRHVADVVKEFHLRGAPVTDLVATLRPLAPRAYSIASSPRATPNEVHLTVGLARYRARGGERRGVASGWLSECKPEQRTVPVYVEPNEQFRLPPDPTVPIIMIGPGTGVAPFRAFLAERREQGASGKSWLFFGDQHLRTDFLYQREWLALRREGVLERLDVAWSRDGAKKTYVQERIRQSGRDVYDWLERGAHVYVCGDGTRMAPDVHRTLLDVVAASGNMSEEKASAYLRDLTSQNRYQRDVY